MILEALDVYFAVALSKQGFKPFSTFGKMQQIQKNPPEATESMNLMIYASQNHLTNQKKSAGG